MIASIDVYDVVQSQRMTNGKTTPMLLPNTVRKIILFYSFDALLVMTQPNPSSIIFKIGKNRQRGVGRNISFLAVSRWLFYPKTTLLFQMKNVTRFWPDEINSMF